MLVNINLQAKIIYQDPVKDAKYVSINNTIVIGFDEIIRSTDLNSLITVRGSLSGIHYGEVILSADRKKLIFKPYQQFSFNENVEVRLSRLKTTGTSNNNLTFSFQTQINKPDFDYIEFMEDENKFTSGNKYAYSENPFVAPSLTVSIS